MDEREIFAIGGASESEAERLSEVARVLAKKSGLSFEEAAYAIQRVMQELRDALEITAGFLIDAFHEIVTEAEGPYIEPRARRRKRERVRARAIEQRYRAEIRRAEGERWYRRIYKPP